MLRFVFVFLYVATRRSAFSWLNAASISWRKVLRSKIASRIKFFRFSRTTSLLLSLLPACVVPLLVPRINALRMNRKTTMPRRVLVSKPGASSICFLSDCTRGSCMRTNLMSDWSILPADTPSRKLNTFPSSLNFLSNAESLVKVSSDMP